MLKSLTPRLWGVTYCIFWSTAGEPNKNEALIKTHFCSVERAAPRKSALEQGRQNIHHTCQFSLWRPGLLQISFKVAMGLEQNKGISLSEGCQHFNKKASLSFPNVDRWADYFSSLLFSPWLPFLHDILWTSPSFFLTPVPPQSYLTFKHC